VQVAGQHQGARMKKISTMPEFRKQKGADPAPLLHQGMRRRSMSDPGFKSSPLEDLPLLALPGIDTRVLKHRKMGINYDTISEPFSEMDDMSLVNIETKFTRSLVVATLLACCPALQYGYNNANMNTAAVVMRNDLGIPIFNLDNDAVWGFCVSVFCLGALVGCTVSGGVADRFGRKRAILMNSAIYILGALLEASSKLPGCPHGYCRLGLGVVLMVTGRAISGAASGATTVLVPMYLGEVSPPELRGMLGTGFQLMCCIAMLVAQVLGLPFVLGSDRLWPIYMLLVIVPALFLFLLQAYLPETPRWLVSRGPQGVDDAKVVLSSLRNMFDGEPKLKEELLAMQEASSKTGSSERYGGFDLLRDRTVRRGLIICSVTAMVQQFSGINNVFNYSTAFLSQNGMSMDTITIITVLMNVGNVMAGLLSAYLMDSAGRRILLLSSSGFMVVGIVMLTAALTCPGQEWTAPMAISAVVLFIMSFGIGMGPIPWLFPAELFPSNRSAVGSSIVASINWFANFLVGQTFPFFSNWLSGYCFIPSAFVLLGFIVFVHRRVPETRGKALEQIFKELNE